MPTTYYLSNGQAKELLLRGRPLSIALPYPPMEITDLVDWSRSVLDPQLRPLVRDAKYAVIRFRPNAKAATGLSSLVGEMLMNDDASHWTVGVECIVVDIAPDRPRIARGRTQLPGRVTHNGSIFQRSETNRQTKTKTRSGRLRPQGRFGPSRPAGPLAGGAAP